MPANWPGPALHHHDFDEAWYLLAGELTFQLGDELVTAGPGELIFAARGSIHTLANRTAEAARYLLIITPAGFEGRFAAHGSLPRWAETTFVGPPIGEAAAAG